ncbi:MAG TPA: hypothetical protein VG870_07945 [Chitinophagaceae bacterium]|nr:hypothetical protein [Chitinophagaceae bacterium]
MTLTDWTGTLGVTLLLLAYLLNLFGLLPRQGIWYGLLNLAGALLACAASVLLRYWPFIILEGVWACVSVAGLLRSPNKLPAK